MTPDLIPFESCDEIVVEELILDSNGTIAFEDENALTMLKELVIDPF